MGGFLPNVPCIEFKWPKILKTTVHACTFLGKVIVASLRFQKKRFNSLSVTCLAQRKEAQVQLDATSCYVSLGK